MSNCQHNQRHNSCDCLRFCTPGEWAGDFIERNYNLDQVWESLNCAGVVPEKAREIRDEFLKQTLANMAVAKRGRQQYKGWKHS